MRYRTDGLKNRICYVVLILAAISGFLAVTVYKHLSVNLRKMSEYKSRQAVDRIIGRAVTEELEKCNDDYLCSKYSEDGSIASLSSDVLKINELENELKGRINEELSHIEDNEISIPVGSLTGLTFLSGRGPDIHIKLHQTGSVEALIKSSFDSAGINQTKHSLKLQIKADITAILPASSSTVTVDDEYIISETVIVGNMPSEIVCSDKILKT